MSDIGLFFKYLAVMAITTYLIRMLPLVLCKKKIENVFIRSFLYYVPYAVLGAMTIPAIFFSTGSVFKLERKKFAYSCRFCKFSSFDC